MYRNLAVHSFYRFSHSGSETKLVTFVYSSFYRYVRIAVCSHTHPDNFTHAKQIKQTSRAPRCTDDNIGRVSERSAAERYRLSRVIVAILLADGLKFRTAGYWNERA